MRCAARGGELEVLWWAREQDYPWDGANVVPLPMRAGTWGCWGGCGSTTVRGIGIRVLYIRPLRAGTGRRCSGRGGTTHCDWDEMTCALRRFEGATRGCCSGRGRMDARGMQASRTRIQPVVRAPLLTGGRLEALMRLRAHECPWGEDHVHQAAWGGHHPLWGRHLDVLKWVPSHDYPWRRGVRRRGAWEGEMYRGGEVVRWCGVDWRDKDAALIGVAADVTVNSRVCSVITLIDQLWLS